MVCPRAETRLNAFKHCRNGKGGAKENGTKIMFIENNK